MKKTIKVMLSLLLVFSLVACSSNKKSDPEPTASSSETQTEQNALIVYYSATGNTENVANQIADITGADLFELEPVQLYTDEDLDWTDDNSRVVYEYENENQRNVELVSTEVENWDSYDTVFIGRNWWGDMPQALYTFLEEYDLSGKAIIPFCPHGGSGFSNTINTIEELQPNAIISEYGLSIPRDDVVNSEDTIVKWLNDLEF